MKKILIFLFVIILIILFIFIVKLYIDMSYTGSSVLHTGFNNSIIKEYIGSLYEPYKKDNENFKTFVAVQNIGMEINKDNEIIFYAWILSESYCKKNGSIEMITNSSMPYKFIIYDNKILQCEFPNNNDYDNSINSIFPQEIKDKFPLTNELDLLRIEIKEQVNLYYNGNYDMNYQSNNIKIDII